MAARYENRLEIQDKFGQDEALQDWDSCPSWNAPPWWGSSPWDHWHSQLLLRRPLHLWRSLRQGQSSLSDLNIDLYNIKRVLVCGQLNEWLNEQPFKKDKNRAIAEIFDLRALWSEQWGDTTWPTKRQWKRQIQRQIQINLVYTFKELVTF